MTIWESILMLDSHSLPITSPAGAWKLCPQGWWDHAHGHGIFLELEELTGMASEFVRSFVR